MIESLIRKATFGIASGLPTAMKQAISPLLKQIKAFFTGLGSGKLYQTSKNVTKKVVTNKLTPKEEEAIKKKYNDGTVNKKDYPTLGDFIKKQIELKNLSPAELQKKIGEDLNKQSIKNVLAWMKKKEGNEIKLWSKLDGVVKLVQQAVGVEPDGSFGTDTEKAVKIAQKKHGLAQDGVVGPETWVKIT